jgi:hypothetical protein
MSINGDECQAINGDENLTKSDSERRIIVQNISETILGMVIDTLARINTQVVLYTTKVMGTQVVLYTAKVMGKRSQNKYPTKSMDQRVSILEESRESFQV